MVKTANKIAALAVVCGLIAPPPAGAWGERGHDIVTRVAVRLLAASIARGTPLAAQFGRKEFMLGHLSNVPDIVWRNRGEAMEKMNAPTHFLDLEYVSPELSFATTPRTLVAALDRMKDLCARRPKGYVCPALEGSSPDENSAGTAPWRVGQLFRLAVASLKAAGAGEEIDDAVDRAFLAAGLMSHFVGDLGNPYHATRNYDGWESGQGGIHSYFESALVSSYRLDLDQEVFDAALAGHGLKRITSRIPAADRSVQSDRPVALALALAFDSHTRLDAANAIDKKVAVTKPSRVGSDGKSLRAERRDPAEVRAKFHDLTVERLATAAEVLADLWFLAWKEAGMPDFKGYQSHAYPVDPDFIRPDYLSGGR
jgi:hypothetical protein